MNNPIMVYRVQDHEGRGPWKPGFSQTWVEDHGEEWFKNHPAWYQEFGFGPMHRAVIGMAFGSGCLSLEQLRDWFSPTEYEKLKGFGYRAVKMEAGRILAESKCQCVFERPLPLNEAVEPVDLY